MTARDPNTRYDSLSKTIGFAITEQIKAQVRTALPGTVVEYDATTKRAKVQPSLLRVYNDRSPQPRAQLIDVPVITPATGGYLIHQELNAGDVVLILFTERGIDEFKKNWGQLSEPTPGKFFADAVAIRWGVEDITPVDNEGIVMQSKDGSTYIKLKNDMIELRCGAKRIRLTPTRGDLS